MQGIVQDGQNMHASYAGSDPFRCICAGNTRKRTMMPHAVTACASCRTSSAAEPADSAGRPPVHHKAKSARRSSKPLRTEWSIMALTPRGSGSEPQKDFGTQSLSAAGLSAVGDGSAAEVRRCLVQGSTRCKQCSA